MHILIIGHVRIIFLMSNGYTIDAKSIGAINIPKGYQRGGRPETDAVLKESLYCIPCASSATASSAPPCCRFRSSRSSSSCRFSSSSLSPCFSTNSACFSSRLRLASTTACVTGKLLTRKFEHGDSDLFLNLSNLFVRSKKVINYQYWNNVSTKSNKMPSSINSEKTLYIIC